MIESQNKGFAHAAIRGTVWRYVTFFSSKLMVFISTVVLARLLSKDDFGVVGFAITALVFIDVLGGGIGPAIIYYSEDKRRSDTAFWLGLAVGFFLFCFTWIMAPYIAAFFHDSRALLVVRAVGLTFPLNALGDAHAAILQKQLAFDRIFIPDFMLAMSKGIVSIVLAFHGFGAWSLIWGQVAGSLISSISFWIVNIWRPSFNFDLQYAKDILNYGIKYISANIVSIISLNLDYLLVGRYLGTEALGVYTLAFRLPDLLILQFAGVLSTVLFPIYTRMRDIPGNLARGFALTTRYVSLITVPLGLGLALIVRPLVIVIFTDKWIDAIPVVQVLAIYAVLRSLAYNAGSAYKADGRPQVITLLEFIRLVFLFPALWWAVTGIKTITAVGWGHMLVALISCVVDLSVAARLLKLPLRELALALWPAASAGFVMAVSVFAVLHFSAGSSDLLQLSLGILVGAVAYLASLWIIQREVVLDASNLVRGALSRGVS